MNLELLFFGLAPLMLYVFVDVKFGMKAGIITAIGSVLILGSYYYFRFGELDELLIIDAFFIVGLGLLSIKLNNSKFFKMQPAIIGTVLTAYLIYNQFFLAPVLLRYLPIMSKMAPELASIFATESAKNYLTIVSMHLIYLFFIHTLIVGYAAIRWSNMKWFMVRLAIYPALIILMIVDQNIYGHVLLGGQS